MEDLCLQGPVYTSSKTMDKKELELMVLPFVKTMVSGRAKHADALNIDAPVPRSIPCCPLM